MDLTLSRDEAVVAEGDTLLLPLRLPWYRSLPLSALEELVVIVDGRPFTGDQVVVSVNGLDRPFPYLRAISDDFWFVQDTAWARVHAQAADDSVRLHVEAAWRIPYLMTGRDTAVVRRIAQDATRRVERSA